MAGVPGGGPWRICSAAARAASSDSKSSTDVPRSSCRGATPRATDEAGHRFGCRHDDLAECLPCFFLAALVYLDLTDDCVHVCSFRHYVATRKLCLPTRASSYSRSGSGRGRHHAKLLHHVHDVHVFALSEYLAVARLDNVAHR